MTPRLVKLADAALQVMHPVERARVGQLDHRLCTLSGRLGTRPEPGTIGSALMLDCARCAELARSNPSA